MPWSTDGITTGATLALKGITMALSNPNIHKARFLRITFYLLVGSLIVYYVSRLVVAIPIAVLRSIFRSLAIAAKADNSRIDNFFHSADAAVREAFISVPLVGTLFIRYLYPQPLDDLFMDSIKFVDEQEAIPEGRRPYQPALAKYGFKMDYWGNFLQYLKRTYKRLQLSLFVYALTFLPVVGRFVVPITSAYAIIGSLGLSAGLAVGACSLVLPRAYGLTILSFIFATRALTRELLEPYFARTGLNTSQRAAWFRRREDVMFGFSVVVYWLVQAPVISVLGFGVAQAAAAYLLVHVTEPPREGGIVAEEEEGKATIVKEGTRGKVEDDDIPTLDVRGVAKHQHEQRQGQGQEQFMQFAGFPQGQFMVYQ